MSESSVITNLSRAVGRARRDSDLPSRTFSTYPGGASEQAISLRTPQQVAAAENRAARIAWGELPDGRRFSQKNVAAKVRAYLGSGLSRSEVARRIGCTRPAVSDALKKIGGQL